MMNSLKLVKRSYLQLENQIFNLLKVFSGQEGTYSPAYCLIPVDPRLAAVPVQGSPKSLLEESILWAVPKKIRSRERVMTRKFGNPNGVMKILPVKKLLTCLHCGHPFEIGFLCPNCFKMRMIATKDVQKAIVDKFGLSPVDKEFIAYYKGEQVPEIPNHIAVEVKKQRPSFFCTNLKTPSTPANPDSTAVDVVPEVKVLK